MSASLRLALPPVPESVRTLGEALEREFGARYGARPEMGEFALAAVEALANIVRHNRPRNRVAVHVRLEPFEAGVALIDDGTPFDMTALPVALPDDPLAEGGRGRYLIDAFTDRFEYRREGEHNIHRLVRRLTLPPPSA